MKAPIKRGGPTQESATKYLCILKALSTCFEQEFGINIQDTKGFLDPDEAHRMSKDGIAFYEGTYDNAITLSHGQITHLFHLGILFSAYKGIVEASGNSKPNPARFDSYTDILSHLTQRDVFETTPAPIWNIFLDNTHFLEHPSCTPDGLHSKLLYSEGLEGSIFRFLYQLTLDLQCERFDYSAEELVIMASIGCNTFATIQNGKGDCHFSRDVLSFGAKCRDGG